MIVFFFSLVGWSSWWVQRHIGTTRTGCNGEMKYVGLSVQQLANNHYFTMCHNISGAVPKYSRQLERLNNKPVMGSSL